MNIIKIKVNSIFILFLILCFTAVHVHADSGNRSFPPGGSGPFFPDHSLSAPAGSGTAWGRMEGDDTGGLILCGVAGNVLGILAGWKLGKDGKTTFPGGKVLGAGIGSLCGSALGVCLVGFSRNSGGTISSALLGSFLGEAAAFALSGILVRVVGNVGWIGALVSFAILPPVGAAILFDRSLTSRSLRAGNGLFNLSEGRIGFGFPEVRVRPYFVPGLDARPELQFNVRVMSVTL
jgi:hypothetical protein